MQVHQFAKGALALLISFTLSPVSAEVDLSKTPSGKYGQDSTHAYIIFSYSHAGFIDTQIRMSGFDIDLILDNQDLSKSQVTVTLPADGADSGLPALDHSIASPMAFDAKNHPEITYVSESIELQSDYAGKIHGHLTLRGIRKPVTLDFQIRAASIHPHPQYRMPALGIHATTTINRSEWGMTAFVDMLGDEVDILVEAEMLEWEALAKLRETVGTPEEQLQRREEGRF